MLCAYLFELSQRNKGLKEWSFGLFEGDSVQLLDAVWDKHDIFWN